MQKLALYRNAIVQAENAWKYPINHFMQHSFHLIRCSAVGLQNITRNSNQRPPRNNSISFLSPNQAFNPSRVLLNIAPTFPIFELRSTLVAGYGTLMTLPFPQISRILKRLNLHTSWRSSLISTGSGFKASEDDDNHTLFKAIVVRSGLIIHVVVSRILETIPNDEVTEVSSVATLRLRLLA